MKLTPGYSRIVLVPATMTLLLVTVGATPVRHVPPDRTIAPIAWDRKCKFDGAGPMRLCVGVLDATALPQLTEPALDGLLGTPANPTIVRKAGAHRKLRCTPTCERSFVHTLVNVDSRNFDVLALPPNKAVLIGGMIFEGGLSSPDSLYGVGDGLLNEPTKKRRTLYMFAYMAPIPAVGKSKQLTYELRWKLVKRSAGSKLEEVAGGRISRCLKTHEPNTVVNSSFVGCDGERILHEISTKSGVSFSELLQVDSFPRNSTRRQHIESVLSKSKLDSAEKAKLQKLLAVLADEGSSRYWFSCASGCCTADF